MLIFESTKTRRPQSIPANTPTSRALSLWPGPHYLFPVSFRAENLRIENVLALARLHLPLDHPRLGHRFLRIDVRDRVPVRRVLLPPRRLDPELLGQHRDQDLDLHVAEARELLDPGCELVPIPRRPPHRGGVPSVVD